MASGDARVLDGDDDVTLVMFADVVAAVWNVGTCHMATLVKRSRAGDEAHDLETMAALCGDAYLPDKVESLEKRFERPADLVRIMRTTLVACGSPRKGVRVTCRWEGRGDRFKAQARFYGTPSGPTGPGEAVEREIIQLAATLLAPEGVNWRHRTGAPEILASGYRPERRAIVVKPPTAPTSAVLRRVAATTARRDARAELLSWLRSVEGGSGLAGRAEDAWREERA